MKKILFLALVFLFLSAGASFALNMTFFGEDLNPNLGTNLTNSNAARSNFFSYLIGVRTEDFESIADGTAAPITVDFGSAGTATLTGGGAILSGYSTGRFPISGDQYWEASTETGLFTINFSTIFWSRLPICHFPICAVE